MDDNDRSALVQQRIKKMLENKKKSNRESGDLTKRLKSNLGDKLTAEEEAEDMPKPSSSMRLRRPTSAMRAADSTKNINANATLPKTDIDVRPVIAFVFEHGAKMKDFLKERRLNREELCERVSEDELFVLRLIGVLRETAEETWNDVAEKMCLGRVGKLLSREEVMRRCEESERRVGSMLEERLKQLGGH
jgi:hypothetical protein